MYCWIFSDLSKKKSLQTTEKILVIIGNTIKKLVPFEAEMPSETIIPPTVGDQADCTAVNSCHVDEFLYDEEDVEKLAKKGKLKRGYCKDCNSRNIGVSSSSQVPTYLVLGCRSVFSTRVHSHNYTILLLFLN